VGFTRDDRIQRRREATSCARPPRVAELRAFASVPERNDMALSAK